MKVYVHGMYNSIRATIPKKQQFTKLKFYLRDITCAERRCEMIQFGYKGIMFGKAESS